MASTNDASPVTFGATRQSRHIGDRRAIVWTMDALAAEDLLHEGLNVLSLVRST